MSRKEVSNKKIGEIAEKVLHHVPPETVIQVTKESARYLPRRYDDVLKHCTPQDPCYWCAVKPLR